MAKTLLKNPLATRIEGDPGFELIDPPAKLADKTSYITNPNFDPVGAAEAHIKRISVEFSFWLEKEETALRTAGIRFSSEPDSADAFHALSKQVHVIKGNASILGCASASVLADPLARMMERCTQNLEAQSIIKLVVTAICGALKSNTPLNDATLNDLTSTLNSISSGM
jgi:hypothetical protein